MPLNSHKVIYQKAILNDTPLINAIQTGNYDAFSRLLQTEDVNERGMDGTTALIEAIYRAHYPEQKKMFFDLLKHPQIDVNLADNAGITALGVAVVYFPYFVEPLLKVGANPDCFTRVRLTGGIDPEGKSYNRWRQLTPLAVAVRKHNKKLALLLLKYQADINKVGDLDISPLSLSGRGDDVLFMKFLIEQGAKIEELPTDWKEFNDDPQKCCSVVMRKVLKYGSCDCLNYLIRQGAKIPPVIYRKNNAYATPLTYLLSQPIMKANRSHYEQCARTLLQLGRKNQLFKDYAAYQPLDIAATDSKGRNALYYAIRSAYPYDLYESLATPQTVNQCDYKGETPFTLAVYKRAILAVHLLLERGANPNAEIWYYPHSIRTLTSNCVKEPVIFYALRNKDMALAKDLIMHGADLLVKNKEGKTPADYMSADFPDNFKQLFETSLEKQRKHASQQIHHMRLRNMALACLERRGENIR